MDGCVVCTCMGVSKSQKKNSKNHDNEIALLLFRREANENYATRLPLRERPRHGHHSPRRLSSSDTSSSAPGGPPSPSTFAKET